MADHDQFAADLVLLALDDLPQTRATELRDHLAGCAACRREFDQLRGDTAVLALSATGSHPPQRSRERLMAAIAKEPRVTRMVQLRPRWWALAPVFAAAVVAIFAILLWAENNSLRNELGHLQT